MTQQWQCWHCGETLKDVLLPFSRRQICEQCNADQHVCRMCQQFNESISGQCDEERAEDVSNKEAANFCDYFSPNPRAFVGGNQDQQTQAKSKLDALFDENKVEKTVQNREENEAPDKAAKARKALDDLFGD